MGRTVSIYLDEELVQLLRKQGGSVSGVVSDALRTHLRRTGQKEWFDLVKKAARAVGTSRGFDAARRAWVETRERDRW
jgi:post-segregation antitoxin (ccd killing protein)